MTDEERHELISNLHRYSIACQPHMPSRRWASAAAKEIHKLADRVERLEKDNKAYAMLFAWRIA